MLDVRRSCEITGWGKCLPPARLTNDDLSQLSDTTDAWIRSRTGIAERRVSHVTMSELARVASARALAAAGIGPEDLDLIILASASSDTLIPCAAATLQHKLGATNAGTFDLNSGCTGFIYGLATACGLISCGQQQRILVAGSERLTWLMDWTQRDTAVLFGDGAGAVVVEACEPGHGVLSWELGCNGKAEDALKVLGLGTDSNRFSKDYAELEVMFDGREIFRNAVRGMAESSRIACRKADLTLADVERVIPHQANKRIIEGVAKELSITAPVFVNIERYGNTSAATIPIALCEAIETGWLRPNQLLLLTAFGAGLTRASMLLRWGPRTTPIESSKAELPPCPGTGLDLIAESVAFARSRKSSGAT